jgi:hypothetical protein
VLGYRLQRLLLRYGYQLRLRLRNWHQVPLRAQHKDSTLRWLRLRRQAHDRITTRPHKLLPWCQHNVAPRKWDWLHACRQHLWLLVDLLLRMRYLQDRCLMCWDWLLLVLLHVLGRRAGLLWLWAWLLQDRYRSRGLLACAVDGHACAHTCQHIRCYETVPQVTQFREALPARGDGAVPHPAKHLQGGSSGMPQETRKGLCLLAAAMA